MREPIEYYGEPDETGKSSRAAKVNPVIALRAE
jgi:hypothetical protein